MALLSSPHWETVSPAMHSLLTFSGKQELISQFYLAGGTGLALKLGHRRSDDLDFFSENDDVDVQTRQGIIQAFMALSPTVAENSIGNLVLIVGGIRVGFFSYHYPLLQPAWQAEGVPVASVADIGLMKLDAMISRGSRKDFYDLYTISQEISLAELLNLGRTKYADVRDFGVMAVEKMLMFDNADRDRQPDLLIDVPWFVVRDFFVEQSVILSNRWFRK
jgi:predicted nucleotidyltransferase component of viral defense system